MIKSSKTTKKAIFRVTMAALMARCATHAKIRSLLVPTQHFSSTARIAILPRHKQAWVTSFDADLKSYGFCAAVMALFRSSHSHPHPQVTPKTRTHVVAERDAEWQMHSQAVRFVASRASTPVSATISVGDKV